MIESAQPAVRESDLWEVTGVDLRISVDPVLFSLQNRKLQALLRFRTWEPFRGVWALPGAINPSGEQIEETMWRELRSMGLPASLWVEQLKTFDRPPHIIGDVTVPGRDPRGRIVSVAYFAIVSPAVLKEWEEKAHSGLEWFPLYALPPLAFDHDEILRYALWRLRNKIQYTPVAFELLPDRFTLTDLQTVYEAVLGAQLDKRNFRRKVLAGRVVVPTEGMSHREKRPARLYRFAEREFAYSPRALKNPLEALPAFGAGAMHVE